jgi:hypothetical protein
VIHSVDPHRGVDHGQGHVAPVGRKTLRWMLTHSVRIWGLGTVMMLRS